MSSQNRQEKIRSLFPDIKPFRFKQIETALFDASIQSWQDITTLSKEMRKILDQEIPFFSLESVVIHQSSNGDTHKASLKTQDDYLIESVLMKNSSGQFTVCVSSQVGCAMKCAFCATGKMGLIRNLDADEIVDQLRFWQRYLASHMDSNSRISNMVYMGMGEPLANYEQVKASLNRILSYTDIGKTHITVSSVGVLPRLEILLDDPDWPHVRMAISLHSADRETRQEIVPTSYDEFLPKLADWSRRYLERFGNRRHHLTFEYVMLANINDAPHHASLLANFVNRIGNIRVNLIPYNFTDCGFTSSTPERVNAFQEILKKKGIIATKRKTQGADIDAACGQLIKANASTRLTMR